MTEREAFEAWALSALKQDAKRWTNHEGYVYLQSEWLAWQASRKQALEEAASLFESRYTEYFPEHISSAIRSLSQPTGGK